MKCHDCGWESSPDEPRPEICPSCGMLLAVTVLDTADSIEIDAAIETGEAEIDEVLMDEAEIELVIDGPVEPLAARPQFVQQPARWKLATGTAAAVFAGLLLLAIGIALLTRDTKDQEEVVLKVPNPSAEPAPNSKAGSDGETPRSTANSTQPNPVPQQPSDNEKPDLIPPASVAVSDPPRPSTTTTVAQASSTTLSARRLSASERESQQELREQAREALRQIKTKRRVVIEQLDTLASIPLEISTVDLDADIAEIDVGQSGKTIYVRHQGNHQLTVIDCLAGEIVEPFELAGDCDRVAAGQYLLMALRNDQQRIDLWDLVSRQKLEPIDISSAGHVSAIDMGSCADRYAALNHRPVGGTPSWSLIDVSLRRLLRLDHLYSWDQTELRASPSGRLYASWAGNQSPQGVQTFRLGKQGVFYRYVHASLGYLAPEFAGARVATASGIFPGPKQQVFAPTFPAIRSPLYLLAQNDKAVICRASDALPIGKVDLQLPGSGLPPSLTPDQRVIFAPGHRRIVIVENLRRLSIGTLDFGNLQRFQHDLESHRSVPFPAIRGSVWRQGIDRTTEDTSFQLDFGPPGMTVDEHGSLKWSVPEDFPAHEATVIVRVILDPPAYRFAAFLVEILAPEDDLREPVTMAWDES